MDNTMKILFAIALAIALSGCQGQREWPACRFGVGAIVKTKLGNLDGQVVKAYRYPNYCAYDVKLFMPHTSNGGGVAGVNIGGFFVGGIDTPQQRIFATHYLKDWELQ